MLSAEKISTMSDAEIRELTAAAKTSGWRYLRDVACTWDEHDKTEDAQHKPFPEKAYIRAICRAWDSYDLMFMEKTRQMLVSWTMTGLFLHDSMVLPARRHFLQSKRQEDANGLLDRARHIYCHTRVMDIDWVPDAKTVGDKIGTSDELFFPDIQSRLTAIPQGEDVVRSWTCSGIFADECNHQPKFELGYQAAQPTIKGGGRYWAVGTPRGKNFAYRRMYAIDDIRQKPLGSHRVDSRAVTELPFQAPKGMDPEMRRFWIERHLLQMTDDEFNSIPFEVLIAAMPGMHYWQTIEGVNVLSLHYSADPEKSPETAIGREWLRREKEGMPPNLWRQEYELDYSAFAGVPVVSAWEPHMHAPGQIIEPDPAYPIVVTVDFGKNCYSMIGQVVTLENQWKQARIIDEIWMQVANTVYLADETVQLLKTEYADWWYTGRVIGYCDPAGNQERETTADASRNTSIKIFGAHGLHLSSRKFGIRDSVDFVDTVFARRYTLSDGTVAPAIEISEKCPYMQEVCSGGWHYPTQDPNAILHPEKDGYYEHGGDDVRYFLCNTFDEFDVVAEKRQGGFRHVAVRERGTGRLVGYRKIPLHPSAVARVIKASRRRRRGQPRLRSSQLFVGR